MFVAIKMFCPHHTGYKIPQIENMGATLDQFDTVDFSDNDLRKLDGFPYLPRLKCLLLNNNRIVYGLFCHSHVKKKIQHLFIQSSVGQSARIHSECGEFNIDGQ